MKSRTEIAKKYTGIAGAMLNVQNPQVALDMLDDIKDLLKASDHLQHFLLKYVAAYNLARLAAVLPKEHADAMNASEALTATHKALLERYGLQNLTEMALKDAMTSVIAGAMDGDPDALNVLDKMEKASRG